MVADLLPMGRCRGEHHWVRKRAAAGCVRRAWTVSGQVRVRRTSSSVSGNLSRKRQACIEPLYSTRRPLPGTQEKEENDRQAREAEVGKTEKKVEALRK